jgi:hypothetical protein
MKGYLIFIPAIALCLCCMAQSEATGICIARPDPGNILQLLFAPVATDPDNVAVCRPGPTERKVFTNIKNNRLYTWIDTTLTCRNLNSDILIVLFNTSAEPKTVHCHYCSRNVGVAVFKQTAPGYILTAFKKYTGFFGGYGTRPAIGLETFRRGGYFLRIETSYAGSGGSHIQTYHYYDLNRIDEKFNYCRMYKWIDRDFFGNSYESVHKSSELIHVRNSSDYDTLKLVVRGYVTDGTQKSQPVKGSEMKKTACDAEIIYCYDDKAGKYRKQ